MNEGKKGREKMAKTGLAQETMQEWRDGQPGCAGRKRGKFCLKELYKGSQVYRQNHLFFCSPECARTRRGK